jgi:RNA polymerase sigma factor (sigma-70 family)
MKNYNLKNYLSYKRDVEKKLKRLKNKKLKDLTRNELIIYFIPYAESIARSFSTSDQASGVMSINDIIQEANAGLVMAIDRLDWFIMNSDDDIEKQIKGFIAKRIKGAVRRGIDMNRGDIRIPEHKLNEIRKDNGENKQMVQMFFNSIFLSIDENENDNNFNEIEDKTIAYNNIILNKYILSLMKSILNDTEYEVLRMSYGLDCEKTPAKLIAEKLNIKGIADYVRVSQIKREALDKLIDKVDPNQVLDFLN